MKFSYIGIFSFLAAARCEGEQSKLSRFSFDDFTPSILTLSK